MVKKKRKRRGPIQYLKDVIHLYDELYYTKQIKNNTRFARNIKHERDKLAIDFIGSYDKDNVSFYYLVNSMPKELYIKFKNRLRLECKQGVRISFITDIKGHKIAWESAAMQSRLRVLRQVGDENKSQDIDAYNLHENISTIGRQSWIEESLNYLAVADKQRGRALLSTSILVVISGKRGEVFDESVKSIENCAANMGIDLERVLYEIPSVLSYFSPFSNEYEKKVADMIPGQVLTDELLARFSTYTQGKQGKSGCYFGTDVYSGFPVLKVVKPKEDTAENILITAETGGGKSFLVKLIILQLLALGFYGTIMDIEGFEYLPLANFMSHNSKVHVINMAEGSGKYFEPMEIADLTGIEDIDSQAKNLAINFAIAIFKVLCGRAYNEDFWIDTVINDAVTEVYDKAGVTDDRETWVNSKGLSLFDVYYTLYDLRDFREDTGYKSAVGKVIAITSRYFEKNGTRSGVFKHKVNVSDIVDADLIICSFGMAGKSVQAVDEVQLNLMQLGAAQLSHQRSIFSKAQGRFNFKLWEEFQRWGKFPDSDKTLGVALTGGRKLGDVNIILTNVLKELLDNDVMGILGNITSFLVGAINDEEVREQFCKRKSIPNMKKELDAIATSLRIDEDDDDSEDILLNKAFLCGLDGGKYSVVKMLVPKDLAKSALLKTGVSTKKQSGAIVKYV